VSWRGDLGGLAWQGRLAVLRDQWARILTILALLGIATGGALHLSDEPGIGDAAWATTTAVILIPLTWSVLRTVARGNVGVDSIALVAMVGALALGEYLAGAVVALMLSGGNALEAAAGRRARRELTELLARAPTVAHLRRGKALEEVPVSEVEPDDVVVVRPGEVVPVDGIVVGGEAVLDEAALTGESLPVTHGPGRGIRSGTTNAGSAFDVRATRPAAESAYAALIRLVEAAQRERAPFLRLADRYAGFFLPVTLLVAGSAWALSGEAIRALAVVVVATPCPLILAAPVAIVSGISRCARNGIVVKGGGAIEQLGAARTVLLDKTGTLTLGAPEVEEVVRTDGASEDELLRLAASVDQLSVHVLAEALVHHAQSRGLELAMPDDPAEDPGQGAEGRVDGHRVAVGSRAFLGSRGYSVPDRLPGARSGDEDGRARVLVGIDGRLAGVIVLADHLRAGAESTVDELKAAGVREVALVSGDRRSVAESIGRVVGVDRVYAEQTPEDKLEVVREIRLDPRRSPVAMVGDGVNDAPALAIADVGIAMGTAGATASSEAADAVIMADRIDRVPTAVRIGRRSLGIARQSIVAGMGMSIAAMGFAAFGYLSPVAGALLQEGIDVAVILNALRALRG
jgi:heavy metal translocating P-type ATPase